MQHDIWKHSSEEFDRRFEVLVNFKTISENVVLKAKLDGVNVSVEQFLINPISQMTNAFSNDRILSIHNV